MKSAKTCYNTMFMGEKMSYNGNNYGDTAQSMATLNNLPSDFYWKNKQNAANRLVAIGQYTVQYRAQFSSGTTFWESDTHFYSVTRSGVIDASPKDGR